MCSQWLLVEFCPVFTGGSTDNDCNWQVPLSTWVNPDMSEDWDKGMITNHNLVLLWEFCVIRRNSI